MPNTYVALATYTVTGSNLSGLTGVTFTGIPSGYTDLVIECQVKTTAPAIMLGQFNGDTTSNYGTTALGGDGSTASSNRSSNASSFYFSSYAHATTSWANYRYNIQNYGNTTTYKTFISRGSNAAYGVDAIAGTWRKTPEAITSVKIYLDRAESYVVGSTFNLYGIANADQAAKATGGIITEDATYWYHTFGASGAFIPKQSLTCDVLVVAGGGGSSFNYAGGGGAGGLLGFTSQSLTATSYNVTVGAGGSAGTSTGVRGTNGIDSQFASLTLVKGGGAGGASEGSSQRTGLTGGSGGGGGGADAVQGYTGTNAGGSPTTSQGFAGGAGRGISGSGSVGGGGGGAGAVGQDAPSSPFSAGNGGVGSTAYSSWGLVTGTGQNVSGTVYYAGGGGGGAYGGPAVGTGGLGGGGVGVLGTVGTAGTANTGGGAGGSGSGSAGGAGGSGVVIVRYLKA